MTWSLRFKGQGLRNWVFGSWCMVDGLRFMVYDFELWSVVYGLWFRVYGACFFGERFRVWDLGCRL